MNVYLEAGSKKVFAGALDWPGLSRAAKDADSALAALVTYAPRYAAVLRAARINFSAPRSAADLQVLERLKGGATTDFGAPEETPAADRLPVSESDLARLLSIQDACWQGLDAAAKRAAGMELRKGPRGGGRELGDIVRHVVESQYGYLRKLNWKAQPAADGSLSSQIEGAQREARAALEAAVLNGLPEHGPRGGTFWLPRYFARRSAWHILDHAWEIEDRMMD